MKRVVALTILGLWLGRGILGLASQYPVTPEVYRVTVNKVELYNSSTDQWVTIAEGDMTFDIASVNAGDVVGGYASGVSIPAGTYTKIRITVSRHMWIKAQVTVGGTTYYTSSNQVTVDLDAGPGTNLVTAVRAVTDSGSYGEGEVIAPSTSNGIHYQVQGEYFTDTQTFSSPVTITKGLNKKIRVKFDVTDSMTFYDGDNVSPPWGTTPFFLPGAPTISIELL